MKFQKAQLQSSSTYALSAEKVRKIYPLLRRGSTWKLLLGHVDGDASIAALNEVSLTVPHGEFVGVIGRNGAGKSTLLRVLGGTYQPTSGVVKVSGDLAGLFELGGIASQRLTGRDYARRILQFFGVTENIEISNLISDIHEFSELAEAFDQPVYTYSTGMGARLYFSIVTAKQHKVYLIDEALSVGDAHFQAKCWERIKLRLTRGASGVLVTHDWSAVLKLCSQCHILDGGRIVRSGPTEEVVRKYLGLSPSLLSEGAKFDEPHLKELNATSGADTAFSFRVRRLTRERMALRYSIEFMRLGIGWEILLLSNDLLIDSDSLNCEVTLKLPRLPLNAGRYYLNLFLLSPHDPNRASVTYDARAWTYGNAFVLNVDGPAAESLIRLPLSATALEVKS
jgi:lipopolysaccharide transport system ATP-binding protein